MDYTLFEGHTPGSWVTETNDYTQVWSGNGAMRVAEVSEPDDFPCFDEDDEGNEGVDLEAECRANASLIAAAPDLLAQCQELEDENARLKEKAEALLACVEFQERFDRHFDETGRVEVSAVEFWEITERLLPEVAALCPPATEADVDARDWTPAPVTPEDWAEFRCYLYDISYEDGDEGPFAQALSRFGREARRSALGMAPTTTDESEAR